MSLSRKRLSSRQLPRGFTRQLTDEPRTLITRSLVGIDIMQKGRKLNLGTIDTRTGSEKEKLRKFVSKAYGNNVRVFDITNNREQAEESRDLIKKDSKIIKTFKFDKIEIVGFQDKNNNQWYAVTGINENL